jgi:hypothetical protein
MKIILPTAEMEATDSFQLIKTGNKIDRKFFYDECEIREKRILD